MSQCCQSYQRSHLATLMGRPSSMSHSGIARCFDWSANWVCGAMQANSSSTSGRIEAQTIDPDGHLIIYGAADDGGFWI